MSGSFFINYQKRYLLDSIVQCFPVYCVIMFCDVPARYLCFDTLNRYSIHITCSKLRKCILAEEYFTACNLMIWTVLKITHMVCTQNI